MHACLYALRSTTVFDVSYTYNMSEATVLRSSDGLLNHRHVSLRLIWRGFTRRPRLAASPSIDRSPARGHCRTALNCATAESGRRTGRCLRVSDYRSRVAEAVGPRGLALEMRWENEVSTSQTNEDGFLCSRVRQASYAFFPKTRSSY